MKTKTFLFIIIIFFSTKVFCDEISNQSVITEEYVAKVIIEGKWGTNAGEFGPPYTVEYDVKARDLSLAVDSKGNIYILDYINNRIQKFNKEGKYLLSIPVESWKGEEVKDQEILIGDEWKYMIKPIEAEGINIAIDSEDNLYYYCHKNLIKTNESGEWIRNPEAKGEVWLFKNDRLVKKWETNVMERFEPAPDYEIEKQKIDKDREKVIIKFKDGRRMEKEVKGKEIKGEICANGSKVLKLKNEILILIDKGNRYDTYIYDLNFNLKSVLKGYVPEEYFSVNDGNSYKISIALDGVRIKRLKREPVKR